MKSAAHAAELADKEGMIYVPPFDDYESHLRPRHHRSGDP